MVSIIIPCYNVEATIENTVNSVLNQSCKDWEIIAINDGSTDNSMSILEVLSSKDERIKVFNESNRGVAAARNLGILQAKGEWIYFLDGDDSVESNLVASIENVSIEFGIVIFEFKQIKNNHSYQHKIKYEYNILKHFLLNQQRIHISSFAIRQSIVKKYKLSFVEGTEYGEDIEYTVKCLACCNNIKFIKNRLFTYTYREGSAISIKRYTFKRFTSVLACERIYNSLKGTANESAALTSLAFTIARHIKLYEEYGCKDDRIKEILVKYSNKYLKPLHYHGWSKTGIYTTIASIIYRNKLIFNWFIRLI